MFNALQTPAPQRAGSTELTGCCVRCFDRGNKIRQMQLQPGVLLLHFYLISL